MPSSITVRRMAFDFAPEMERVFIRDDPAGSYLFLGAWMMLPYLEPFLIRSMGQALPHIADPLLREEVRAFCAQEGEHHRQHARANDVIRGLRPGFAALRPLEAALDTEYRRFSKTRPLRFNLAFSEGFEALTCATARTQLELGAFDLVKSPLADLAKWHVMEELEHRSVAFDVYRVAGAGHAYRIAVGAYAQWHFARWALRFARLMRASDPQMMTAYDRATCRAARNAFNRRFAMRLLPRILQAHTPWYDPAKLVMPEAFEAARRQFGVGPGGTAAVGARAI